MQVKPPPPPPLHIFTDGSCKNKRNERQEGCCGIDGGYGVVVVDNEIITHQISAGSYFNTTSQRMEILATIKALHYCYTNHRSRKIIIHCDSQYVVNTISKQWIFNWEQDGLEKRTNGSLWKMFLQYFRMFEKNQIQLQWIKGHNGQEYNELADQLARNGAVNGAKIEDIFG